MKKIISLAAITWSLTSFSLLHDYGTCRSLRPAQKYFSIEYVLAEVGAPNSDDGCFEDLDTDIQQQECYQEFKEWLDWKHCLIEEQII